MTLAKIQETLDQTTKSFQDLIEKQSGEIKQFGETTEQTAAQIKQAEEQLADLSNELKQIGERFDDFEARSQKADDGKPVEKNMGEQFIESEAYQELKARGYRGDSQAVEIKDISGDGASAGALLTPYLRNQILSEPDQMVFVRQLLPNIPVNTDAVQIFRELAFTNNAGIQANPVAGKLQEKPQSEITFESDTVAIETIAHYVIASRQILSDAPRLAQYINGRLVYGLNLVVDQQILYGDGTGQNFTGLMVDPGVQDVGAAGSATAIDHIRDAITMAQEANYYNVNGLVMGPADWAEIEKAKGSDGHYIWVNVQNGGQPRLWRVPVVVSNAMQAGDFILGDFTLGAAVYTREGVTVRTSESHADYFVRNGVAVLAEERCALGIELPRAFVKGTFEATT